MWRIHLMVALLAAGALSCGNVPAAALEGAPDGGLATMVSSDAGSTDSTFDGGFGALPCEVATLLRTRCVSCHRTPLVGGATMPLTSYAELTAPSFLGGTFAARSLTRMKDPLAPMPPGGLLPASEVAPFEAWIGNGAPMGTCGVAPDAGTPMVTCASNRSWTNRYQGSGDMNPGMACRACHAGQNFKGQNPQGGSELRRQYFFAGTVFPGPNEKDACLEAPPAGVTVEILDGTGAVKLTMTPRSGSGNFYNTTVLSAPSWLPYTARLKRNGLVVSTMRTPQMSGDCNTCHTELGELGAPGRITVSP